MTKFKELKCKTYCMCTHCGEKYCGNASGGCAIFCQNCRTVQSRKEMCGENRNIVENYKCDMCEIYGPSEKYN